MPRLTDSDYLKIHHRLARLWSVADGVFGYLSPDDQWHLHEYFQPSKSWSDSQLIAHRLVISAAQPSLPQQAGRALSKLDHHAAAWAVKKVRPAPVRARKAGKATTRNITARPVVRPELDPHKIARAFISLARAKGQTCSRP